MVFSNLARRYDIVQMNRTFIVVILVTFTLASQSPYLGKISLKPLAQGTPSQVITFRPLSQQPKIANLKNNEVQLKMVSDQVSCTLIPPSYSASPAMMAVIDISKKINMTCGLGIKKNRLKQAGFKGFLLVNDSQTLQKNYCHMLDDSQFLMGSINTQTFEILKKYYEVGSKEVPSFEVKGLLSIELFNSSLKLLQVWTSSLNSKTYQTIQMLGRSMQKLTTLQSHVQWTPRIASYDCVHGQSAEICANGVQFSSCGCKGQFCSPQTRQKTPAPLIKQDIRQYIIFKQYYSKYFAYMSSFKEKCLSIYKRQRYAEECATSVMESLQIDSYSINEVINSFLDQCADPKQARSSFIYATLQKDQRAFASYGRYPLVLINKQPVEYKNEDDFNGVLCNKLQLLDNGCFTVVDNTTVITSTTSIVFFALLILCLVSIGAAVVYCYRKKLKREMNKQIKMQVSTAVEHYFALTETSHSAK